MKNLTSGVKKLVTARWFPTFTKPIILGIVGSGIVASLSVVGVHVLPDQAEAAAAPLVGFLLTAVAQKADPPKPQAQSSPSLGKTIADSFAPQIAKVIDANPALVQGVAAKALESVLALPPIDLSVIATPVAPAVTTAQVPVVTGITTPASTAAPHITQ